MIRPTRMLSTEVSTATDCPAPPHWSAGFCRNEFRLWPGAKILRRAKVRTSHVLVAIFNSSDAKLPPRAIRSALLIALFLSGGCGGDSAVGKVHGKVTLDGQPLPKAVVTFMPVRGGRQSSGFTDADGQYRLSYLRDRMGAQVGAHRISIHTSGTEETDRTHEEERVPAKYNTQTTLQRDVAPGDNEFSFDLLSE